MLLQSACQGQSAFWNCADCLVSVIVVVVVVIVVVIVVGGVVVVVIVAVVVSDICIV